MHVESTGLRKNLRIEEWPILQAVNGKKICVHMNIEICQYP
jgi:hypothetical protein